MEYGVFRLCMNYHDTHSNIWDLPCKSQSCASLRKFCANVVPNEKVIYFDISSNRLLNFFLHLWSVYYRVLEENKTVST